MKYGSTPGGARLYRNHLAPFPPTSETGKDLAVMMSSAVLLRHVWLHFLCVDRLDVWFGVQGCG